jgi:hypothetical protein
VGARIRGGAEAVCDAVCCKLAICAHHSSRELHTFSNRIVRGELSDSSSDMYNNDVGKEISEVKWRLNERHPFFLFMSFIRL